MKGAVLTCLMAGLMGASVSPVLAQAPSSGFTGSNFGIQVDLNHLMGTSNVAVFGPAPDFTPQSSQDGNLPGIGFSYGFQFGSDANKYQHWALVPVLGIRSGTQKDSQQFGTLETLSGSFTNAMVTRKTKTEEIFLSIPLRWYTQQKGQLGDGFFLEAGAILANSKQTVDLEVTGEFAGQTPSYKYQVKYTKNRGGYLVGIGDSFPIGNHGLDLGVEYLSLPSSEPLPAHSLRVYVQWYF